MPAAADGSVATLSAVALVCVCAEVVEVWIPWKALVEEQGGQDTGTKEFEKLAVLTITASVKDKFMYMLREFVESTITTHLLAATYYLPLICVTALSAVTHFIIIIDRREEDLSFFGAKSYSKKSEIKNPIGIQKYPDCDRCRPTRAASVPWLVYLLWLSLLCCCIALMHIFQLVVLNLNRFFSF